MNFLKIFDSKSEKIVDWYKELSENNVKAARKLKQLCHSINSIGEIEKEVTKLEHQSDKICHDIFDELNRVFITPMDREDIVALARCLDDVMDLIHLTVNTISAYNIKKMSKRSVLFADVIVTSTEVVSKALPKLIKRKTFSQINKDVIELNGLETRADELLKDGLKELFKNPKNAVDVIRWRDIYTMMEEITDKTEDIADILGGLTMKYA